jgi:hypothetical protein
MMSTDVHYLSDVNCSILHGGVDQSFRQGDNNLEHRGPAKYDMVDFDEAKIGGPGNIRVEYGKLQYHHTHVVFLLLALSFAAPCLLSYSTLPSLPAALPSANMGIVDAGIFWPLEADPDFELVALYPFPARIAGGGVVEEYQTMRATLSISSGTGSGNNPIFTTRSS